MEVESQQDPQGTRANRRAAYKQRWYREHLPQVRRRRRRYYWDHAEEARAAAKAYHQAQQPHVPSAELERLRRPENRLEALCYGPERKAVCLNCSLIGENLSRHVGACPVRPEKSPAYKEHWGYNRTAGLTSPSFHEQASRSKRESKRLQEFQKRNRAKVLATFEAERTRRSEGKRRGESIRLGPLRAQARDARRGRRPTPRRDQKVSDETLLRILALDLPVEEGAKRVGLSVATFYHRVRRLGWTADSVQARRRAIIRYIFELRAWLRAQQPLPTVKQILQRHVAELRKGSGSPFQDFNPFLPALEGELSGTPGMIAQLVGPKGSWAVFSLASKVLKRARTGQRKGGPVRRGRKAGMLPRTRATITVAADRAVRGVTLYAMARDLYRRQNNTDLAYKSTKELFRRYRPEIEAEKLRLATLPEMRRNEEVSRAGRVLAE